MWYEHLRSPVTRHVLCGVRASLRTALQAIHEFDAFGRELALGRSFHSGLISPSHLGEILETKMFTSVYGVIDGLLQENNSEKSKHFIHRS